jgi:YVTN family beta-propeller protein
VAFSPDGSRAYTANHESNLVSVIDVPTLTVLGTIPVGMSPHSIAVHPSLPLAANVNYDAGTVSVIDTSTDQVTRDHPSPPAPVRPAPRYCPTAARPISAISAAGRPPCWNSLADPCESNLAR